MQTSPALGVLWGKSDASGRPNLLLQHLLDTAAVGELVWDRFLSPALKERFDRTCGGQGRLVFVWLCGLHDIGKACPAFQSKVPELAVRLRDAGLLWDKLTLAERTWHHAFAGAVIVRRKLAETWEPKTVSWVWPMIAGHHGSVPSPGKLRPPSKARTQGSRPWEVAQDDLFTAVCEALDVEPGAISAPTAPRREDQLALLGAIVMADWVASDERHFCGVDDVSRVSLSVARERAESAWTRLRLRGGWQPDRLGKGPALITDRFDVDAARPVQNAAIALAEELPAPGLLLVEAPTGEGKTEAALAAAEVLARRFKADGLFVGMPTQATADAMFSRVRRWADRIEAGVPLALLHGKRRFNKEWRAIEESIRFGGIDDEDIYGLDSPESPSTAAPSEWLLGRKRGLLVPLAVGTVDQLLHAVTRTKHVMLQHAGLAGHILVLDEVHAYDVYTSQFLHEALRWMGDGGVPVVVLSATLTPEIRLALLGSYLQGALAQREIDLPTLPAAVGYPTVYAVCVREGQVHFQPPKPCEPWRESLHVDVDVLDEPSETASTCVPELLRDRLRDGGCALVVRNTVSRAQEMYSAVRAVFPNDTVLLHARLTTGARAEITERLLGELGPQDPDSRPRRRIVVATQVAEQSFDVDVDLLITDLAPIDLLLQRAGRLHRHARPADQRPPLVRGPRVVVTGAHWGTSAEPPTFPRGSEKVYGRSALLRAAALVLNAAAHGGWSLPADVPSLVALGYRPEPAVPEAWAEAVAEADGLWRREAVSREERATQFLLAGPQSLGDSTLAGLHHNSVAELRDEDAVAAVVRDGDSSTEVILVRRDERQYLTLSGRPLGVTGEAVSDPDVLEEVLQSTVRLPGWQRLTEAAQRELRPLPAWSRNDPWLGSARVLVLSGKGSAVLGGTRLTYDKELGLTAEWEG